MSNYRRTEIIITILVIIGLALYAIPRFIKAQRVAKEKTCHENVVSIERDIEIYQLAGDESLPASLDDVYGAGRVGESIPVCPLKGAYRMENGQVFCNHE